MGLPMRGLLDSNCLILQMENIAELLITEEGHLRRKKFQESLWSGNGLWAGRPSDQLPYGQLGHLARLTPLGNTLSPDGLIYYPLLWTILNKIPCYLDAPKPIKIGGKTELNSEPSQFNGNNCWQSPPRYCLKNSVTKPKITWPVLTSRL